MGTLSFNSHTEGCTNSFHPLKKRGGGGGREVLPCLKGGCKRCQHHDFHAFRTPPPPPPRNQ